MEFVIWIREREIRERGGCNSRVGGEEGEGNGEWVRTSRRNREIHAGMCTGIGMVDGRMKSWEHGVEERENSGEGCS